MLLGQAIHTDLPLCPSLIKVEMMEKEEDRWAKENLEELFKIIWRTYSLEENQQQTIL